MTRFRDNASAHRYEYDTPEGMSVADYRDVGGVRSIVHVETPPQARGRGYAAQLMAEIVASARAEGPTLAASCSYAAAYFRRHPDAGDVLA